MRNTERVQGPTPLIPARTSSHGCPIPSVQEDEVPSSGWGFRPNHVRRSDPSESRDWNFQHIDFAERSGKAPSEAEQPRQYVLPFIENVHESDIQVVRAKAVKPDSLELTVQIRFVS
jgi:hypothetical protein